MVSRYILILVSSVSLGLCIVYERTGLRRLAYEIADLKREQSMLEEKKQRLNLHVARLGSRNRIENLVDAMNLDLVPAAEFQVRTMLADSIAGERETVWTRRGPANSTGVTGGSRVSATITRPGGASSVVKARTEAQLPGRVGLKTQGRASQ